MHDELYSQSFQGVLKARSGGILEKVWWEFFPDPLLWDHRSEKVNEYALLSQLSCG